MCWVPPTPLFVPGAQGFGGVETLLTFLTETHSFDLPTAYSNHVRGNLYVDTQQLISITV